MRMIKITEEKEHFKEDNDEKENITEDERKRG